MSMKQKTIAIVNQKGGTGKTTTTVSLGCALVREGKRVLLVDMDAQGNLGYCLGITEPEKTIADVFTGDATLAEVKVEREGADVIPSDVSLADIELSLADTQDRHAVLRSLLENETTYEYILIDCPPSLSLLTVNALHAANLVVVPMQMEVLALQGLELISKTIGKVKNAYNPQLKILGILPVMVDTRRKLSQEVLEHIRTNYDILVFDTPIRANVRASEAPSFGQSVITYAPSSNSAQDYRAFARKLITLV